MPKMSATDALGRLRALQAAAVRLGQLLELAGTFPDEVPRGVWERIAQAGGFDRKVASGLRSS